jgi:hypothetical protein
MTSSREDLASAEGLAGTEDPASLEDTTSTEGLAGTGQDEPGWIGEALR